VKSGEEPRLAYNRVLLSSVLAREARASDISLRADGLVTTHVRSAAHAADVLGMTRQRLANRL
jgi:NAD(P)H-nitrite reductase large subunit